MPPFPEWIRRRSNPQQGLCVPVGRLNSGLVAVDDFEVDFAASEGSLHFCYGLVDYRLEHRVGGIHAAVPEGNCSAIRRRNDLRGVDALPGVLLITEESWLCWP